MTKSLIFWVLMLIWLVFSFWSGWRKEGDKWGGIGGTVLQFVLFLLLGWKVFGSPIQD